MFVYPNINPIAVSFGPIKIYWYGLMYLVGISAVWLLAIYRANQASSHWTRDQISETVFYATLGVVVGGRLGEMLFYEFSQFMAQPWLVFEIWKGGMSFHGGVIGTLIGMYAAGKKIHKSFFEITDFFMPLVPIALGAGRLGNFINGELWGRATNVPWAMIYPHVDVRPRHPSEIYEMLLEGALLFIVLWFYSATPKPRMAVTGLAALGYGVVRIFAELFREPEPLQGFLYGNWLTMGQVLSIPMVIAGIIMMAYAYKCNMKPSNSIT